MAIIGKIRKHSGLAVIIVGVAIAAFVIGDFGKKRSKGVNNVGSVNGEAITYMDFNTKVDENLENLKEQNGEETKITEVQTYNAREQTWNKMVKDLVLQGEYDKLGLTVTPEELFDQVQGRNPHRYILQYFKDPKTGIYDPAMVLNYLKNLDRMEPKAKTQWLQFEKAIKEDRGESKLNNLIVKAYYVPKAFLKKEFEDESRTLHIRYISPPAQEIPDSTVKLSNEDFQKFYDENKKFFYQDEPLRDLDYVVFNVTPSDLDRKKIAEDVEQLYQELQTATDIPNFINANSDKKYDSNYVKKGVLPGMLDSLAFISPKGTIFPPFELNNNWYMGKLLNAEERPDSIKASMILVSYAETNISQSIKRNKDEAKKLADSLMAVLKRDPAKYAEFAKTFSDYPTGKEEGGDLGWIADGKSNYQLFFDKSTDMKINDLKIVETGIGYAIVKLTDRTKLYKKVRFALMQINIAPSNQTYQDIYLKASAFAGQFKTPEAFDKAAKEQGIAKREAQGVKQMDNYIMGLPNAREIVRWAYAENTNVGEVSPVFDMSGSYVIAVLKEKYDKGYVPLDQVRARIEPSVRNQKKAEMLAEKMTRALQTTKDLNTLASEFNTQVDTTMITFAGYNRASIGREPSVIGKLFTIPKNQVTGPLIGKLGAYLVIVDDIIEPSQKEDYTYERNQMIQSFSGRAANGIYDVLKKAANIEDNRSMFY